MWRLRRIVRADVTGLAKSCIVDADGRLLTLFADGTLVVDGDQPGVFTVAFGLCYAGSDRQGPPISAIGLCNSDQLVLAVGAHHPGALFAAEWPVRLPRGSVVHALGCARSAAISRLSTHRCSDGNDVVVVGYGDGGASFMTGRVADGALAAAALTGHGDADGGGSTLSCVQATCGVPHAGELAAAGVTATVVAARTRVPSVTLEVWAIRPSSRRRPATAGNLPGPLASTVLPERPASAFEAVLLGEVRDPAAAAGAAPVTTLDATSWPFSHTGPAEASRLLSVDVTRHSTTTARELAAGHGGVHTNRALLCAGHANGVVTVWEVIVVASTRHSTGLSPAPAVAALSSHVACIAASAWQRVEPVLTLTLAPPAPTGPPDDPFQVVVARADGSLVLYQLEGSSGYDGAARSDAGAAPLVRLRPARSFPTGSSPLLPLATQALLTAPAHPAAPLTSGALATSPSPTSSLGGVARVATPLAAASLATLHGLYTCTALSPRNSELAAVTGGGSVVWLTA
jgi:hypothetical protein